eukprot:SAG31_NODE_14228_length_819_cov_1.598611_1_plen_268_part_01
MSFGRGAVAAAAAAYETELERKETTASEAAAKSEEQLSELSAVHTAAMMEMVSAAQHAEEMSALRSTLEAEHASAMAEAGAEAAQAADLATKHESAVEALRAQAAAHALEVAELESSASGAVAAAAAAYETKLDMVHTLAHRFGHQARSAQRILSAWHVFAMAKSRRRGRMGKLAVQAVTQRNSCLLKAVVGGWRLIVIQRDRSIQTMVRGAFLFAFYERCHYDGESLILVMAGCWIGTSFDLAGTRLHGFPRLCTCASAIRSQIPTC